VCVFIAANSCERILFSVFNSYPAGDRIACFARRPRPLFPITATNLLLLAALLWVPAAWCIVWQTSKWLIPAVVLPLIFATPLASLSLKRYASGELSSLLGQQLTAQNLFAPANFFLGFLEDRRHSFPAYNTYAGGLRSRTFPDLDIHGTADVYPISQTVALPLGLTCLPRPIFQSCSAYTPKLAEMNAAHLRSQ
jgi:hypothetical protein